MVFYDSKGRAVAYTEDNENIYLFNGEPVAYIYKDLVYNYNGIHLGRFEKGWIRDKIGNCAFFTDDAIGNGPIKPMKQIQPIKAIKRIKPIKGVRHIPSMKTLDSLSWSNVSGERFFM